VTLTTPVSVGVGGAVTVHATGVTNPAAGIHTPTVATSTDSTIASSGFFFTHDDLRSLEGVDLGFWRALRRPGRPQAAVPAS
jgi:hypothetical protein